MIAMINKSVARTAVILLLISLAVIEVEVANANPFWEFHTIKPIPGTIPAEVVITNPINNTEYFTNHAPFANNITISLFVTKPYLALWDSSIASITIKIDGSKTAYALDDFVNNRTTSGVPGISEYNKTFTLTTYSSASLSPGNHSLTITAYGNVKNPDNKDIFTTNSSSTLYFTILDTIDPFPTPTVPEFPATLAITLLAIIALAVVVVFRRKT
jgi:hypothetical protein